MLQILPGRPLLPRNGLPLHQEHSRRGAPLRTNSRPLHPGRAATDPAASQHHIQTEYHQQPLVRKVPHPEPRRNAGVEFDPALFQPHQRLSYGRLLPARSSCRKYQNHRVDLPDRFARRLLHQEQTFRQRRCGPGQPPANRLCQYLFRYFGRRDRKTLQPLPDFLQKARNFSASTEPRPTNGSSGNV